MSDSSDDESGQYDELQADSNSLYDNCDTGAIEGTNESSSSSADAR